MVKAKLSKDDERNNGISRRIFPSSKKGIVRVIESAIAVLLVLGFVIFIQQKQIPKQDFSGMAYKIQHQILLEMENNQTMRNIILSNSTRNADSYVRSRMIPYTFDFILKSCSVDGACPCLECPKNTEIYADDMIFSNNLTSYQPKKLAFFMWYQVTAPVTPPQPPAGCVENWQCGVWSTCIAGQQIRTCNDINNCGTTANKLAELQSCCTPDEPRVTWKNAIASTDNCKKIETCNAQGTGWTVTKDYGTVKSESSAFGDCTDSVDNDCDGKCDETGCGTLPLEGSDCPLV